MLDGYLEGETAENRFGELAQIEAIRAAEERADETGNTEPIVDIQGRPVRLVETDEGRKIEVQDPDTEEWEIETVEFDSTDNYPDGPGIGQADAVIEEKIGNPHEAASTAADPTPDADDEDHSETIDDADVWVPIVRRPPESEEPPIVTPGGLQDWMDDLGLGDPDESA